MRNDLRLYFGLPQNQWDNLIFEAENILQEKELGSHIVGIYPAGKRIFGLESESEGIFCLYIDSVESLINPALASKQKAYSENSGLSQRSIIMMELYEWARKIISYDPSLAYCFLHAIPFGRNLIYQDSAIESIMSHAYNLLSYRSFRYIDSRVIAVSSEVELRAHAILRQDKEFTPCINPEWDAVHKMSQDLTRKEYIEMLSMPNGNTTSPTKDKGYCQEFGAAVAKLYRFQL